MPNEAPSGYKLERKRSLTHFLIGIFGAAAIIGVMAKIFNFQAEIFGYVVTWQPVVLVGFLGEALVFIIMGMMREMQYVPVDEETEVEEEREPTGTGLEIESDVLGEAGEALTQEAQALAEELRSVREAISRQQEVYQELTSLHGVLREANADLSEHVGALESNMKSLREAYHEEIPMAREMVEIRGDLTNSSKELHAEMEEARTAVQTMQEEVASTAQRFAEFNRPGQANGA